MSSGPTEQNRGESPFRYAVHTIFLDEVIAPVAADVGFDTVVQVLHWRDLNPRPGLYTWSPGDYMVRNARAHGLELVVRLDRPPVWAVVPDEQAHGGFPFDPTAYVDFIGAVAGCYRGHVVGYIIWNEPNLAAEWSRSGGDFPEHWASFDGWVADPADYVHLLCIAYERIRAADALVVTAGLAPTNEISSRAVDDRQFLRQMYALGATGCFDVLSVHNYGYGLSPEEERGAHGGLNLARILDLREIMLAYGDSKPVWITELGYTVQSDSQRVLHNHPQAPSPRPRGRLGAENRFKGEVSSHRPPPRRGLRASFRATSPLCELCNILTHPAVSEEEQAAYLTGAFERVRRDWPWVEMLTVFDRMVMDTHAYFTIPAYRHDPKVKGDEGLSRKFLG